MPIFEQTIFGHNSKAIFRQIGLKILIGTLDNIIYPLVMRNPSYDVFFFSFLIFWVNFCGENGRGHHASPK